MPGRRPGQGRDRGPGALVGPDALVLAGDGCAALSVYLPGNDFNTMFKGVPASFLQEQQRRNLII